MIRPELLAYVGDALLGISLGPRLSDEIGDAVRWVMRINATPFRPYEKARATTRASKNAEVWSGSA